MTLTRSTYVERVLIVLNPDGTLKGAHQESLDAVMDGETKISEMMLGAAPLDAETLGQILPSQAALIAQTQSLLLQVTDLTKERDRLANQNQSLLAARLELQTWDSD